MNVSHLIDRSTPTDFEWMASTLGSSSAVYRPDLVIAPDGEPYLLRWHLAPRNVASINAYLHMQVASDPHRPLHDHPWVNTSHIVSGSYTELLQVMAPFGEIERCVRKPGDVTHREAGWAHRLILPADMPYVLTLFTTGPKIHTWGFWEGANFVPYTERVCTEHGVSVNTEAT